MTAIEQAAQWVSESTSTVFFGGAGVSTESGVKDYRSEDGLYNTVRQYGVPPETILSHDFLFGKPAVFYDFYATYFLRTEASPNRAHEALAKLEKRGKLDAVITQNIDGLHQKAGSKNVIELHGTAAEHYCAKCKKPVSREVIRELDGKVPYCACGGLIRPNVVMYGEGLNDDTVNRAIRALARAEVLVIGGTSLAVYPAAAFLEYFRGDKIILINKSETPYDTRADLVFRESIGAVLSGIEERVQ